MTQERLELRKKPRGRRRSGCAARSPPESGVTVYEVFRQGGRANPSLMPETSPRLTRRLPRRTREQYGRRGESVALWVVPRESVLRIEEFVDELQHATTTGSTATRGRRS